MATRKTYRILACDGGGIRGVISTRLLQGLDPAVLDSIDLFAGTSTGSIIALGLAAGVSLQTLFDLYGSGTSCRSIFQPYLSDAERMQVEAELRRTDLRVRAALAAEPEGPARLGDLWPWVLRAGANLLYPKYRSDGLRALLTEYLPAKSLADVWRERGKAIVAPAFQIDADDGGTWQARLFHNLPNLPPPDLGDTLLLDAVMSSAAAPIYFPPHSVAGVGSFVDGGVFANTPSAAALAALAGSGLLQKAGIERSQVLMLSVGTGFTADRYPPAGSRLPPFGILGWLWPEAREDAPALPLLEAMFDGNSQVDQMGTALALAPGNSFRIDVPVQTSFGLDDCASIDAMIAATEAYMAGAEWQTLATQINAAFAS